MSKKSAVLNSILNYEENFKGGLLSGYNDKKTFVNDVMLSLNNKQDVSDMISYYRTYLVSSNNTNSTIDQRKCLDDLILLLEGFSI